MVFISSFPGFFKAQSMSAGWSKSFSLLLLDRVKTVGIRRRKKKKRAGSLWQNQSATQCTCVFSRHCCWASGCVFLTVCMCVFVSWCLCVCACMYIRVSTWFGLWSVSPRLAFQSLLQSRTETYLTAAGKIELLCGVCFKWVLF